MKVYIHFPFGKHGGGGNQFLSALERELNDRGLLADSITAADVVLINSFQSLADVALMRYKYSDTLFVHRVDGPIGKVRGKDRRYDALISLANWMCADGTVYQSHWSKAQQSTLMDTDSATSTVVLNGVNTEIFSQKSTVVCGKKDSQKNDKNFSHALNAQAGSKSTLPSLKNNDRKVRLIAVSNSSNWKKGFGVYHYLDAHLDWDTYEMTFVGNTPVEFENIRHVAPCDSETLAKILRSHDLFITASKDDPCSNALLEALSCDLPAVYLDSGGNPEIVGKAGVGFDGKHDVIGAIDTALLNYAALVDELGDYSINRVATTYIEFIQKLTVKNRGPIQLYVVRFLSFLIPWIEKLLNSNYYQMLLYNLSAEIQRRLGMGKIILRKATNNIPVISFAGQLPSPTQASGGCVKLLHLDEAFEANEDRCTVVYLVSSCLPHNSKQVIEQAKQADIPVVWNQNGVGYPGWAGDEYNDVNKSMKSGLHAADFVVYQSQFCKDSADRYLGEYTGPHQILHNPVDTQMFRPAETTVQRPLTLAVMGSHYQKERVFLAVEVLHKLRGQGKEARLIVGGKLVWSESAYHDLHQLLLKYGLVDVVDMFGTYSQTNAPVIYQRADILLHLKYNDPSPTVPLEAMACGVPVIGSASGGMPELVESGATGILVDVPQSYMRQHYPSVDELANAVTHVHGLLAKMRKASRVRVVNEFSKKRWIEKHQEIFENLAGTH